MYRAASRPSWPVVLSICAVLVVPLSACASDQSLTASAGSSTSPATSRPSSVDPGTTLLPGDCADWAQVLGKSQPAPNVMAASLARLSKSQNAKVAEYAAAASNRYAEFMSSGTGSSIEGDSQFVLQMSKLDAELRHVCQK